MMKIRSYKDLVSFDEDIIEKTKELMTKIWGQPKNVRIHAINNWLQFMADKHEISKPNFNMVQGEEGRNMYNATGGGSYSPSENTISLYRKFSLTTLLHEYRHCLQHKKFNVDRENNSITDLSTGEVVFEGNVKLALELDARIWSCSLYYNADEERYRSAMKRGILHFF